MFVAIWTTISLLILSALPAVASSCRDVMFEQVPFTVCETDPSTQDIRLFLNDANGDPLGTFDNIQAMVAFEGLEVAFAMNAGMYHPDRRPVGLFVEDHETIGPLVEREGPGNFGLLPNGVLCLEEAAASVVETRRFAREKPDCRYATQSGPMLVIEGDLHPRFIPDSDSRFIRNGVGVTPEGMLISAIANRPVNFHRFARLFRDVLGTPNALYMDGKVSRLYAPGLNRRDIGFPMGPMLGVLRPAD